jgi:hypothetical protein
MCAVTMFATMMSRVSRDSVKGRFLEKWNGKTVICCKTLSADFLGGFRKEAKDKMSAR